MDYSNKEQAASLHIDTLLLPFLEATTEEEEELLLVQLLNDHINPIVRQILRYKLQWDFNQREGSYRNQDIEEAYHEIQLHLLKRLRNFKSQPINKAVTDLRSYVATTARNACDEYLRRKYPQRRNLKDKIRYSLTSRSELALWEEAGAGWLAGLADWERRRKPASSSSNVRSDSDLLESLAGKLKSVDVQRLELHQLLTLIFQILGFPVELDQLTAVVAKLRRIEDTPTTSFDVGSHPLSEQLASLQPNADTLVEYHQLLERLWVEIQQLPRRQRVALLCNLKNQQGINVITLFPATRVATFEQIAAALEIPLEEFEGLWSKLPLDDLSLAQYLGITRQQVINLRRSARDRLMRRMNFLERKPGDSNISRKSTSDKNELMRKRPQSD
jgi:RNA polymerase sigma factor (sigma-70 family)